MIPTLRARALVNMPSTVEPTTRWQSSSDPSSEGSLRSEGSLKYPEDTAQTACDRRSHSVMVGKAVMEGIQLTVDFLLGLLADRPRRTRNA
ncbi:MAG TPA: hypothetical protein VNU46_10390 [Gemmatimonadaceae bacterium]|nr:hypothetical protein [Gemmatimonadaceae bacterium]